MTRTPYKRLSGGQQQRLSLAAAVIGRPELVFLDEPTAGMDPQARHATWDLIGQLRADGVSVILTTHFMEEAERLSDHVAIIDTASWSPTARPASSPARSASSGSARKPAWTSTACSPRFRRPAWRRSPRPGTT